MLGYARPMLTPTVLPGLEPPWWLEEALALESDTSETEPLQGDVEADVAILGGGYTGLWTALALREREPGLRIAVLEGEICGWGPSGRNGGFLRGFWTDLAQLRGLLGDGPALELARAGSRIIPAIRAFCESHGEDIWLREAGYLKVSAAPAQDAALARYEEAARALGVEETAIPLSAPEVAQRLRSPRFRRGVFFPECATIQPARLVRALRRAALANGVVLYERTRVSRLRAGRPNVVEAGTGRVSAPEIVVATNAWMAGWKPVRSKLTNFGSYVVLTEPVPELLAEIGWTGGEAVSDARMFLHYFRTTGDGRVLMGSGSGPIGFGGKVDARFTADAATVARAERGLRRLLPGLAAARIERAWGGPVDVAADHQPFFGTAAKTRIHYGAGYSGHGVGPAWLGGQILASLALGRDDEWTALPLVHRRVHLLPPEPIRGLGGGLVRTAILACEHAEEVERRPSLLARAVASLPRRLGLEIGTR